MMRPCVRLALALAGAAGLLAGSAVSHGAPMPRDEAARTLADANDALRSALGDGAGERAIDPDAARADARLALRDYLRLRDSGFDSPALLANIGAAHGAAGDHGRAVLFLRAASERDPSLPGVRAALTDARVRAAPRVPPVEPVAWEWTAREWVAAVGPGALAVAFIVAWALFFALGALRVLGSRSVATSRWLIGACAAIAALAGGAVVLDASLTHLDAVGVVTEPEIIARQGPDATAHGPALDAPLRAGTEFELMTRRDGWLRVRLGDGREGWIPERAATMLRDA